jgi:uncharacterized coiled-coil protein SlyX
MTLLKTKDYNSMKSLIQFKTTIPALLVPLVLICFGLAPMAQAVGPDTDGTIPGSNNGEGIGVLVSRTTGIWNTGTGFDALNHLTAGNQNTATGLRALFSDINGGFNTATGVYSLFSNTSGFFNSATGAYSLANNVSGTQNTANGYAALYRNTADGNTATGFGALFRNTTGSDNTAVGDEALSNNTDGNSNTALGFNAGMDPGIGSNNIYIGDAGFAGDNNVIAIGGVSATGTAYTDCFIGGIFGNPSPGSAVYIAADGHLSTTASSRRFKDEIKPMDKASEAIFALKPVTFRYKKEIDPTGMSQFGLVAEDVEKVRPDLVARDREGKLYTVRYDQVNAMLLNEFLKEHRKVEGQEATITELRSAAAKQEATIGQLKKGMETFVARLKEQAAQIQKVSAQLEVTKAAPRTVLNK